MHFNQDDINTGERLRGIRESMKMNREEFSEKIDITDSFLGQIERGERALSVKTLRKVVKYTGVSADYLLFGKDTNNETIQKINNILFEELENKNNFIIDKKLAQVTAFLKKFCDGVLLENPKYTSSISNILKPIIEKSQSKKRKRYKTNEIYQEEFYKENEDFENSHR